MKYSLPALALATLAVLLFVLLLVCAAITSRLASCDAGARHGGAVARRRAATESPHVVVDTLNLIHWLHGANDKPVTVTSELIAASIDRTAAQIAARHQGRVMYVLKDRDSQFNDEAARDLYRRAAERNGVYVYLAERYPDPPRGSTASSAEHSAGGRDDFFVAVLAHRWRCAVLTEDRLRDFDQFRATVQPFHVYEFAFWRAAPVREFVRPDSRAYARLKKPRAVRFASYFGERG